MASSPATLSDSVSTLVRDYLVCPERSHECGQQFSVEENKLSCACGRIYPLESGVPALRQIDIIDEFTNNPIKNPVENRYCETPFVNTYIVRQYGPLLRRTSATPCKSIRFFDRLPVFTGGAESFYQVLFGLCVP